MEKKIVLEDNYAINPSLITKWFMSCLIAALISVNIGCTTIRYTSPEIENSTIFELQAAIEQFELTKGIDCIDIPNIYDISNLKVKSAVKFKRDDVLIQTTQILNDIQVTDNGRLYEIVKITGDKPSFTKIEYISTLNGSKIICNDAEIKDKYEQYISTDFKDEDYSGSASQKKDFAVNTLLFGVIGATFLNSTMKGLHEVERSSDKLIEGIAASANVRETKTKIINFKLISREDLIISGRPIDCKVYQFDTITQLKEPPPLDSGRMYLEGSAMINIEHSSKRLWISDEVPFGIVKVDEKYTTIGPLSDGSVIKFKKYNKYKAIEFKYGE